MKDVDAQLYLLRAEILWDRIADRSVYPFSLPAMSKTDKIEFHPKVTFFVGENGSGKSTRIEALAVAWGFNPEGGTKNFNFKTRESHSSLSKYLRLVKSTRRARDGFFLRAESYFRTFVLTNGACGSNGDRTIERPRLGWRQILRPQLVFWLKPHVRALQI